MGNRTFTICSETDSQDLLIKMSGITAKVSTAGGHKQQHECAHAQKAWGGMAANVPPSSSTSMRFEIAEACTVAAICLCTVAHLTQDVQDGRWPIHLRPGTIAFQASTDEHANK